MLAGLTSQRSLTAQSYAVSFSIMAVISIALLLALLSWPFVKLLLIGDAQRIKAHDVVLVGTSALLGIALITISISICTPTKRSKPPSTISCRCSPKTSVGTRTTKSKRRSQFARLETAVDRPDFLYPRFPEEQSSATSPVVDASGRRAGEAVPVERRGFAKLPGLRILLADRSVGTQIQKMTLGSFVTPRITVDDREYFIHWTTPAADATAFFKPIQSATTGAREAVVSTRTIGRVARSASRCER